MPVEVPALGLPAVLLSLPASHPPLPCLRPFHTRPLQIVSPEILSRLLQTILDGMQDVVSPCC